jgi:hypothetical protein
VYNLYVDAVVLLARYTECVSSCVTWFLVERGRSSIIIFQIFVKWLVIVQSLSDTFPIKNGLKQRYALSPLLFRSVSEYIIRGIQENQYGLKLNGTHQFWFMLMLIYWAVGYIL